MGRYGFMAFAGAFMMALLCVSGCSGSHDVAPNQSTDFASTTPQTAEGYGADVIRVQAHESAYLSGAANKSQTSFYDGLELRVAGAQLLSYDEFIERYPSYPDYGWQDSGENFLCVSIDVTNASAEVVEFAVDELTVYSDVLVYEDGTQYWNGVLEAALAEDYGDPSIRDADLGGSWGYVEGWNLLQPGQTKSFVVPFWITANGGVVTQGLRMAKVDDFMLQVFSAYSNSDLARGVKPTPCYLFALSEEGDS